MNVIMRKGLYLFSACVMLLLASCNNSSSSSSPEGYATVHFDTRTEIETNYIEDQVLKIGSLVKEPAVVCPKDLNANIKINGWYSDTNYKNKWDFEKYTISSDLTLYAKWAEMVTVSYYLKGSDSPIWVVTNASKGEPLERHDELCDGYEFYGYFSDKNCTIPFDLEAPIEEETNVYMYRGETLHLHADSIKRRFVMKAAGGSGSTAGQISEVKTDPSGLKCVDVNFGYSTSADPYMLISNPQIDISKSQKIKIKFKNFGAGTSIAFYWVSQYENGDYAANYRSDTEANAYHDVLNGYECFMTEDDPWIEREFDLSSKLNNGISTWGNSVKLVHLRIQVGYISRNSNDTSNVIRIASIDGITDDTHVGFEDSAEIKKLLVNDSEEDITRAQDSQVQNRGVIFPKNIDKVDNLSSKHYVKKNGLLLYSSYGSDINRYFFDVSNQNIDAEEYSYVTIKLNNLSYISSISLYVNTKDPVTGRTLSNVVNVPIGIRMNRFSTTNINYFGKLNMVGIIQSFSILFNYNGVDNAIILESISIDKNKSFQVPGFNFNDPKYAGFVSTSDISLAFNHQLSSTTFTVNSPSSISYNLDYVLNIKPYSYLKFSYYILEAGINKVRIRLKINNAWEEYVVDVADPSGKNVIETLDLKDADIIQALELVFDGTGSIHINSIEFALDQASSWDSSNQAVFARMLSDWAEPINYVDDQKAVLFNNPSTGFRYYFGYLYSSNSRDTGNISLEGKTKIYFIYKNLNDYGTPFISAYAVDAEEEDDFMGAINERSAFVANHVMNINKNMDEKSWDVYEIDIPAAYQNSRYYFSNFFIGSLNNTEIDIYIRGIVVK